MLPTTEEMEFEKEKYRGVKRKLEKLLEEM